MSKKREKQYNHYVPQFYLKNFSGNKSIGLYNFKIKKFVDEASIRDVAGKDYLYGEDNQLEDFFSNLERKWSNVINTIINTEHLPLDSEEYTYLIMFVFLSDARGVEVADAFYEDKLVEGKNIARIMRKAGKLDVTDEWIDNLDVKIDRPNLPFIQNLSSSVRIMSDLCPLLIINETNLSFITSDRPVVIYNRWFVEKNFLQPCGFGQMGLQVFVPISGRICFCLYDDHVYENKYGYKDRIRIYRKETIKELNSIFVENAYREIYYPKDTRTFLEGIVGEKTEIKRDYGTWGNEEIGFIQKTSLRRVTKRYALTMFSTRQFFRDAQFPYDFPGGPLRKNAYYEIYGSEDSGKDEE